jgi:altronate dehydratase
MNASPLAFDRAGRLPAPGDNVAIAIRRLEAGLRIAGPDEPFRLSHTILEGHRFAVRAIAPETPLLSWGLPFGRALRLIHPGEYICNAAMLQALAERAVDFELPSAPNFADVVEPYVLDERNFQPGKQVAPAHEPRTFRGFRRNGARGVGTRNYIVILGLTSAAAGFARRLAEQLRDAAALYPNLDGVVPVAHTEGSGPEPLHNLDLLLRTLAGFAVHPNVGAVLLAGADSEPVNAARLIHFMEANRYPWSEVVHGTLSLSGDFAADLERGIEVVRGWLKAVGAAPRAEVALAHLRLALQCGGSDAYSGVTANPLVAGLAREIIRFGGSANLAETLELVGAEAYVLQNVRDLETARQFLRRVARYKALLSWHGASPEGNPSGGNRYRGLYNIALKSLGAAQKRHPQVRLDEVIDYAAPMTTPGFYFMDSPGNDLESIAGQVASGANLICFTTGNGSITNFPFVPTIKFVTTTGRYQLLSREMDINAGVYLEGAPMEALVAEALDRAIAIASGELSVGERAGHSQVSIWRNWRQTGAARRTSPAPRLAGQPIPIRTADAPALGFQFQALRAGGRLVTDQVGLILPTSLCAGQIARLSAEALNRQRSEGAARLSRFVALAHTEGCGAAGPSAQAVLAETLLSYARHPLVGAALLLEHGCEVTHNDFFRHRFRERGLEVERFGWASIQMDGGLEKVLSRIEGWFAEAAARLPAPESQPADASALRLGLMSAEGAADSLTSICAGLAQFIVRAGGIVVVPEHTPLLQAPTFTGVIAADTSAPSLAYGQLVERAGFHIMAAPSAHWTETLTGLAATGVEIIVACAGGRPGPVHPLVPVLQVSSEPGDGFDLTLSASAEAGLAALLDKIADVASRRYIPRSLALGEIDFQMTRGVMGVSV